MGSSQKKLTGKLQTATPPSLKKIRMKAGQNQNGVNQKSAVKVQQGIFEILLFSLQLAVAEECAPRDSNPEPID
jgi:hypothetical protein